MGYSQEVIIEQFSKINARILTADGIDLTNDSNGPPQNRLSSQ